MKKTSAQLQREIDEALAQRSGLTAEQIARYRSGRKWGWPADLAFKVATDRPLSRTPGRRSHATRRGRHVAHHGEHWAGSEIQALLFDKQWTVPEAKQWAREHGYRSGKAHVTDNYIRLRQFEPSSGAEKRTITLGQGIKAILEQVK